MELTPNQIAFIALLTQMGIFDIKSGNATLSINFDSNGNIGSVAVTKTEHYKLPK